MFFEAPRPAVRNGKCEFAVTVEGPVIFFLYRFGHTITWSDVPYSWCLVPEVQWSLPEPEGEESPALLHIILVNAGTGIVRVLRGVTLSPAFTQALDEAIRAQAAAPWRVRAGCGGRARTLAQER
jgi:hypothetical protein